MNRNKIYIAGPMTGFQNYNFEKFYEIEKILINKGLKPINPARITDENGGQMLFLNDVAIQREILDIQMKAIENECSEIVLLDGWQHSIGAKKELELALKHNLQVKLLSEI